MACDASCFPLKLAMIQIEKAGPVILTCWVRLLASSFKWDAHKWCQDVKLLTNCLKASDIRIYSIILQLFPSMQCENES